jgi:LCP family protein required for cell wall assembly
MTRSAILNNKPYTVYAVRRSKARRVARVALFTLLFVTLFVVALFGGLYLWFDRQVSTANRVQTPADREAVRVLDEEQDPSTVDPELEKPDAQDILVLGSDFRPDMGEEYGRSDTLMIVHIAPDEDFVSIISVPRDLRVQVPGHGYQKINAAFALGGSALAIQTVQSLLHIDLDHYVNLNFQAFRDITTALGGVYVDVDTRYYNATGAYEKVDIQPGYQRLEGENALDFVRFRHDGYGDFHRIERQQLFLHAARSQISKWDIARKIPDIIRGMTDNMKTDITTPEVLKLVSWGVGLNGARIKQVKLESDLDMVDGISYVVASETALRNAAQDLVAPPAASSGSESAAGSSSTGTSVAPSSMTTPVRVDLTGVTVGVLNGNGRSGEAHATASWLETMGAIIGRAADASRAQTNSEVVYPPEAAESAQKVAKALGVTTLREDAPGGSITVVLGTDFVIPEEYRPRPSIGEVPNAAEWKSLGTQASFPLMAPGSVPYPYKYKDSRLYEIDTGDGSYPALKVYYKYGGRDLYWGIMQTTFLDAPAAAEGEEVTVYGTDYTIVGSPGHIERVWWKNDGVLYWVSNTLGYAFSREEMLAIATSMIPVP